jgi:hypothetical protein
MNVVLSPFCYTLASEIYMPTFRNTLFHPHRQLRPTMQMELTKCSKMPAYKIHMTGNHPKETTQVSDISFGGLSTNITLGPRYKPF